MRNTRFAALSLDTIDWLSPDAAPAIDLINRQWLVVCYDAAPPCTGSPQLENLLSSVDAAVIGNREAPLQSLRATVSPSSPCFRAASRSAEYQPGSFTYQQRLPPVSSINLIVLSQLEVDNDRRMIRGIERVLIDDDGVLRRMDRFWRVEDVV